MILLMSRVKLLEEFIIGSNLSEIFFYKSINLATYGITSAYQSKVHVNVSGTCLCDSYLVELSCLTWNWASFISRPVQYASIHQYMWCSHSQIVPSCTDCIASGIFFSMSRKCCHNCPRGISWLSPEIFNKIEFAVKLWQENAEMPSFFNGFLDVGLLLLKIELELEDVLVAASSSQRLSQSDNALSEYISGWYSLSFGQQLTVTTSITAVRKTFKVQFYRTEFNTKAFGCFYSIYWSIYWWWQRFIGGALVGVELLCSDIGAKHFFAIV